MSLITKVLISLVFVLVLSIFCFLSLGKWLDVTQKPMQAELIVCLGGGTVDRVKRSIALIEQGYVQKDLLLLLGESWYNQPYIKKHHPELHVVIAEEPTNTKEEVLYIKKYMLEHGYKTALVVTDPPHTRRVELLNAMLSVKGDEDLHLRLIGSGVKWWDKEKYYDHVRSGKAVLNESMKILYSIVVYGVLHNLGVSVE